MRAARCSILPEVSSALSVVRHIHGQSRGSALQSDMCGTGREGSSQVIRSRYLPLHRLRSSHTTAHVTYRRESASKALIQ